MNYAKLTPKVAAVLVDHPDWTDQQVADELNAATVTQTYSRFVTFRTVLSELPTTQAMSIIGKVKANAVVDAEAPAELQAIQAVLAEVLPSLTDTAEGCGIDMQNANARGLVDSLVTAGVLTSDEGAAVKGMAERLVSWAASEGLPEITDGHIGSARIYLEAE